VAGTGQGLQTHIGGRPERLMPGPRWRRWVRDRGKSKTVGDSGLVPKPLLDGEPRTVLSGPSALPPMRAPPGAIIPPGPPGYLHPDVPRAAAV